MSDDNLEVYRGHTEECLRHFVGVFTVNVPKGSRGAGQAKVSMADFCQVQVATITRWFGGSVSSFPKGETFIRLMFFLDLIGYRVIELERLSKVSRNFAELIVFGFVSVDQAMQVLGYIDTSTFYNVLLGEHRAQQKKEAVMWNTWKERRDELRVQKEMWSVRLKNDFVFLFPVTELKTQNQPRSKAISSIMEGLLGLLESSSSSDILDLPADIIIRLSTHLNALCSSLHSQQEAGER